MNKLATGLCAAILFAAASAASAQGGSISGTAKFEGKAKPRKLNNLVAGDKYCGPQNANNDVWSEDAIVGANGELANVFVWVKEGITGKVPDAPADVVEIDQIKCVYKPHILIVRVGQTFRIKNSDDTMHNIHGEPKLNKVFNEGQGVKGMTSDKVFTLQEIGVRIKCDVHAWMGAVLHVVGHPYYSLSGADGKFSITGLPAGKYKVEAWHEKYGSQVVEVTLGDKEAKDQPFTFKPK